MANIVIISLEKRKPGAIAVQKILTDSGCIIKTRLGMHDVLNGSCADKGLIIIDLLGSAKEIKSMLAKLKKVGGVKAKFVTI